MKIGPSEDKGHSRGVTCRCMLRIERGAVKNLALSSGENLKRVDWPMWRKVHDVLVWGRDVVYEKENRLQWAKDNMRVDFQNFYLSTKRVLLEMGRMVGASDRWWIARFTMNVWGADSLYVWCIWDRIWITWLRFDFRHQLYIYQWYFSLVRVVLSDF